MGSGTEQASEAVRRVPLAGLPGVRSVSYALSLAAAAAVTGPAVPRGVAAAPVLKAGGGAPVGTVPVASSGASLTPEQLRAKAYVMKGQQLMGEQNYESAANNFEQALNLDPGNAGAKSGLRAAKKALGEPE
jgi:hypothetical protein